MINEITLVSLGSAETIPIHRHLTATYVNADGDEYLIEAPEGVQRQLLRRGLGLSVDMIFITTFKKRSVLGLPGLLNTMSFFANRERPLTIYCPPGGIERVRSIVSWFDDIKFTVNVKELIPGRFKHSTDRYRVETLNTSPYGCYGLVFTEQNPRGRFDREKAEAFGVPVGPKFTALCNGNAVEARDGTIVKPEDVLSEAPDPLTIVYSGRTKPTETVTNAAARANVLIHDAGTLDHLPSLSDRSTLSEAVAVANEAQPQMLFLNHISSRVGCSDADLITRARTYQEGDYDINVYSAGMELRVTRNQTEISHRSE